MAATAVRLIATDLDGTLLRTDHTISPRTRAAIRDAGLAGITVVAATGRGWRSATPLLDPVPEISTAVLSNGALIRDLDIGRDTHVFPIGREPLAEALSVVQALVPEAGLFWETTDDYGFDHTYAALRAQLRPELGDTDDVVATDGPPSVDVLKVLVRHPDLSGASLFDLVAPRLPEAVTVAFSGGPNLVEITGAGVHKASALAVLCDHLAIDASEVVAIGDNNNDAEMLRWAGLGVAMGNARPEALDAADTQTHHHMDDGVAAVIEMVLDRPS